VGPESRLPKRTTIVLAEDHGVVREGLRLLLGVEPDMEVVGEASTGREAVALVLKLLPEVVVMDIAMPGLNGMEATRQIRKALPPGVARVLILSAHGEPAYVHRVMEFGAAGFVLKQASAHLLVGAIREVRKGKTFLGPSVLPAPRLDGALPVRGGSGAPPVIELTPREMEVLQLIAEGRANKQVAGDLGISVKTVEKHRQSLMEKLGIHDTAGLTRHAIAQGIIESSVQPTVQGQLADVTG
jgi:DNA-binding NarL/FixJ family response regulator